MPQEGTTMATQTPEKTNGAAAVQNATAIRPYGAFARDPIGLATMRRFMDSFFDATPFPALAAEFEPPVNLYEKDGTYTLECAVPGYKKEDLTVEVSGDRVMISGSYSCEKNEERNHYHRREVQQDSFTRTLALPQEVDPDKVTAKLENGLLKLTLHPTASIKHKTIPILE
jgi:HSP20 family protein